MMLIIENAIIQSNESSFNVKCIDAYLWRLLFPVMTEQSNAN